MLEKKKRKTIESETSIKFRMIRYTSNIFLP